MRKLVAAGLALLALGGALAACGSTSVDEVEDQVTSELKAQLARQNKIPGVEGEVTQVDRVDCPDDVDTGQGSAFRCRALDPQGKAVGTVTVTMAAGDDARWQFVAAAPQ
jgi:hypothetical protein